MGTTSKALMLLEAFTRQRPSVGLSDLARLTGLNKATCFRLAGELAGHGLVEQDPLTKAYRLGPAVVRLAAIREAVLPLREAAQPVLQALAVDTDETAHLSQMEGGRLRTLAFAYGAPQGMRVMMEDADVLPFHATSSGYAVLAWLSPEAAAAALATPMGALTEATPRDPATVGVKVAESRARGWASTEHTYEAGVASLALPLFDAGGAVQGALAVAAPGVRLTEAARARALPRMVRAARSLMGLWGGAVPPGLDALWRGIETGGETG